MSHGLGRRHAPDERDRNFPLQAVVPKEPRRHYRYWWDSGVFLDQGSKPHCVGYSITHYVNDGPVTHKQRYRDEFADSLYYEAQRIDEWPGENYAGTSVRAGLKVLQARGLIGEYRWGFTLDDLLLCVLEHSPVVVGTYWYSSMFQPDDEGFISVSGSVEGGHAYLITGCSMTRGVLRIKNSWGTSWAQRGRAWISFEDMERLIHEDGDIAIATTEKTT